MRNNLKLMVIILLSLLLCLLTGCLGFTIEVEEGGGDDTLDEPAKIIIKALENGDAEAIKELFSKEALEQAENIDDEIQAAIDFFEGSVPEDFSLDDISVPGHYPGYMEHASTRHGITVILKTGLYDVMTDKASYAMSIELYSRCDENPDMEGVVTIEIVPYEKRRSEGFKWQAYSGNGDVGVFIQDADTEPITEEISEEETEDIDWSVYYDEGLDFGCQWFGGEEYGYMQIADDFEEFTEMPNENRPNMIMMRNAAKTVIISVDYFDEVTSEEEAKNVADQIAANAVREGASLSAYDGFMTLGDYAAYVRSGTVDEATETTEEYYLEFIVAYIPELNRGVYISVEGAYADMVYAMAEIKGTYTATR